MRTTLFVIAGILASSVGLDAQAPAAPIPRQIGTARKVFVSNAGSDSYGADVYYQLNLYDGGPDRLYNSYYRALSQWGRLELVDAPSQADVVHAVRFASPAVAQRDSLHSVYDPQLVLTFIDPKTQIVLWSLTEHVEPAFTRSGRNANFDRAVLRLVARTKLLIESPAEAARVSARPPAGADRQYELHRRATHARTGALLGFSAAALYELASFKRACSDVATAAQTCPGRGFNSAWLMNLGAAGVGGVLGWILPVRGREQRSPSH